MTGRRTTSLLVSAALCAALATVPGTPHAAPPDTARASATGTSTWHVSQPVTWRLLERGVSLYGRDEVLGHIDDDRGIARFAYTLPVIKASRGGSDDVVKHAGALIFTTGSGDSTRILFLNDIRLSPDKGAVFADVGFSQAPMVVPYMGLGLQSLIGRGVEISAVVAGGPAEAVGLRVGDIITRFNGQLVDQSWTLREGLRDLDPGDTLVLKVKRGNRESTVRLVLGSELIKYGVNTALKSMKVFTLKPTSPVRPCNFSYTLKVAVNFAAAAAGQLGTFLPAGSRFGSGVTKCTVG